MALTLLYAWPLVLSFGSRLPSDIGDPGLNTWILWWNAHAVPLTPRWWNAPIFFPIAGRLRAIRNTARRCADHHAASVGGRRSRRGVQHLLSCCRTSRRRWRRTPWPGSSHAATAPHSSRASRMASIPIARRSSPTCRCSCPAGCLWRCSRSIAISIAIDAAIWRCLAPPGCSTASRADTSCSFSPSWPVAGCCGLRARGGNCWRSRRRSASRRWRWRRCSRATRGTRPRSASRADRRNLTSTARTSARSGLSLRFVWLSSHWTLAPRAEGELYPGVIVLAVIVAGAVVAWRRRARTAVSPVERPGRRRTRRALLAASALVGLVAVDVVDLRRLERVAGGTAALDEPSIQDHDHGDVAADAVAPAPPASAGRVAAPLDGRLLRPGGRRHVRPGARSAAPCVRRADLLSGAVRVADDAARRAISARAGALRDAGHAVPVADGGLGAHPHQRPDGPRSCWWPRSCSASRSTAGCRCSRRIRFRPRSIYRGSIASIPVLELPMEGVYSDTAAMLRATDHRHPLVNGFSGYLPRHYPALQEAMQEFNPDGLRGLRVSNPLLVVVNRAGDPGRQVPRIRRRRPRCGARSRNRGCDDLLAARYFQRTLRSK